MLLGPPGGRAGRHRRRAVRAGHVQDRGGQRGVLVVRPWWKRRDGCRSGAAAGSGGAGGGKGEKRADYERRCLERHGVHAEYDDEFAVCVCAEGYGPDQSEQCVIDLVQVMTYPATTGVLRANNVATGRLRRIDPFCWR